MNIPAQGHEVFARLIDLIVSIAIWRMSPNSLISRKSKMKFLGTPLSFQGCRNE